MHGDLLPFQLVYTGKTARCHPPFSFPSDWSVTHSKNHWSNESTMLEYVNNVIVPYVGKVRNDLGVEVSQSALALFDHFKGQMTDAVTAVLEKHNILSILIPANCTDRLQPMDKSAKSILRAEFEAWYAAEVVKNQQENDEADGESFTPVNMLTARMKSIGGQWLIRLFEHLAMSPDIISNGFLKSGIPQSIDSRVPYLAADDDDAADSDDDVADSDDDATDSPDDEYDDDGIRRI